MAEIPDIVKKSAPWVLGGVLVIGAWNREIISNYIDGKSSSAGGAGSVSGSPEIPGLPPQNKGGETPTPEVRKDTTSGVPGARQERVAKQTETIRIYPTQIREINGSFVTLVDNYPIDNGSRHCYVFEGAVPFQIGDRIYGRKITVREMDPLTEDKYRNTNLWGQASTWVVVE